MKPVIVTHEEWVKAREKLLEEEKEFTRRRDELSKSRRALPWEPVTKGYTFDGPNGETETLSQLFGNKTQLIVYSFMLGASDDAGCIGCSFLADHFNGVVAHLAQRDTTFVVVSRAPYDKIQMYKERMGWTFKWISAGPGNDFPFDTQTAFTKEQMGTKAVYNYKEFTPSGTELFGVNVFAKDEHGDVFHTYSSYSRGLDMFIGTYHWLDITPKGRDEADLPYGMAWVRRHDEYENSSGHGCGHEK
jgi:predicted dithiol-disulfide oxidoreductase (DUF899 family)